MSRPWQQNRAGRGWRRPQEVTAIMTRRSQQDTQPKDIQGPEYLNMPDFAARLNISVDTVKRMVRDGKVRAYRVGGRNIVRIPATEIKRVLTPLGPVRGM